MFADLENRPAFKNLPVEIDSLSYFPNENGQVLVANITLTPRLQKLFDEVEVIFSNPQNTELSKKTNLQIKNIFAL